MFRYLIYIIVEQQYRRMGNALLFCNKSEDVLHDSVSAILEICFQRSTHMSWTKGKRGVHRGEVALSLTWDRIPEWYCKPSHGRSYLHPTVRSARAEKVSEVIITAFTHLITDLELKRKVQRFPNSKSDFKCYWQITEKIITHSWTYPRVINQSYSKVEVRLELLLQYLFFTVGAPEKQASACPTIEHSWAKRNSKGHYR